MVARPHTHRRVFVHRDVGDRRVKVRSRHPPSMRSQVGSRNSGRGQSRSISPSDVEDVIGVVMMSRARRRVGLRVERLDAPDLPILVVGQQIETSFRTLFHFADAGRQGQTLLLGHGTVLDP